MSLNTVKIRGMRQAAPRFGGGDKCGRCGKTAYFAEAREGPHNIKYHKSCFTCLACNKSLDSHFAERMHFRPPPLLCGRRL